MATENVAVTGKAFKKNPVSKGPFRSKRPYKINLTLQCSSIEVPLPLVSQKTGDNHNQQAQGYANYQ